MVRRTLPLFPLERVVLFPGMPLPLQIFEDRYKVMIGMCELTDRLFGVVLIRSGREVGAPPVTEMVGCTAAIVDLDRVPDGRILLVAAGKQRFRLLAPPTVQPEGYLQGEVEVEDDEPDDPGALPEGVLERVREELREYVGHLTTLTGSGAAAPQPLPDDLPPDVLSYRVASLLTVPARERQALLEMASTAERLQREVALLRRENFTLRLMAQGAHGASREQGPFSRN